MLRISRLLAAALLLTAVTGCDSGDEDDGPSALDCRSVGLTPGTLSGTATSGSVAANCFNVESRTTGGVFVVAFDVPSLTVPPRATLLLSFESTETGSYALGSDSRSSAQYTPSGSSSFDAASGTITLSEFSGGRVRGGFDFTTVNGIQVSGGTFDVTL